MHITAVELDANFTPKRKCFTREQGFGALELKACEEFRGAVSVLRLDQLSRLISVLCGNMFSFKDACHPRRAWCEILKDRASLPTANLRSPVLSSQLGPVVQISHPVYGPASQQAGCKPAKDFQPNSTEKTLVT